MHRRAAALISLVLILIVTATSLASPAWETPNWSNRHRSASRSLAQATPAGMPDIAGGNVVVTILDTDVGGFKFEVSQEETDGYVVWHNDSSAAHHLEITIHGVVTSRVELEQNETYEMRPEQGGLLHFECTTHGESGTFHI